MTDMTDLEIFARVARTGNMSAAGREMRLSAAVVSKRISMLEQRLGARLFLRTTRQLTLTDIGEGYFRRVVDILNLVEEAHDFVGRRSSSPRGSVKLSVDPALGRRLLMPLLPDFRTAFPRIELQVHVADDAVDFVRDAFDLALRAGAAPGPTAEARELMRARRIVVAAPAYLEQRGEPKGLADLGDHVCLAGAEEDVWALERADEVGAVAITAPVRLDSRDLVLEGAMRGLGIGFVYDFDAGEAIAAGTLKHILPEFQGAGAHGVYALYPSRDFMPSRVATLIEFLASRLGTPVAGAPASNARDGLSAAA